MLVFYQNNKDKDVEINLDSIVGEDIDESNEVYEFLVAVSAAGDRVEFVVQIRTPRYGRECARGGKGRVGWSGSKLVC